MFGFFSGWGLKLVVGAAILAVVALFLWKVYRAGGDAARLQQARADMEHSLRTAREIAKADKNLTLPATGRQARIRDMFSRREKP